MGVCTLTYNSASGSNTAASGSNVPTTAITDVTTGQTASATGSSNQIDFSSNVDLTGISNDGTDVIWVNGNAGERHLFRITALLGTIGSCAGVTVSEAVGSTSFAGSAWAIGGKRQTFENDTSRTDGQDWSQGWVIELDDNQTVTVTSGISFGNLGGTVTTGFSEIKASSAASSRPVISATTDIILMEFHDLATASGRFRFTGIKFWLNNGSATANAVIGAGTTTVFDDCVFVSEGTSGVVASGGDEVTDLGRTLFRHCYFEGGAYCTSCIGDDGQRTYIGCTFTGAATSNILVGNPMDQSAIEIMFCLVKSSSGKGIEIAGDWYRDVIVSCCTIVDNTGDGISIEGWNSMSFTIFDCLITNNGGIGINGDGADVDTDLKAWCDHNAFYLNTGGHRNNISAGANDVELTADPYTNRGGGDYTLNNTAGGGAAVKSAGYPGVYPDGT